jgi:uncharacterized protein (DUF58 family)
LLTTAEILKRVRQIEIKTKGLSNHMFAGEYHSAFKGRGMSFSEVREYQFGDDVRAIDWNVTARMRSPYIKVHEEERELTVMLVADISASNSFGTDRLLKKELMAELCAIIAFSAIKNNDKVGLLLFSSQVELFISPKKGKSHILRIIRELISFEPKHKGTDIAKALIMLNNLLKKRCITFVISDFISENFNEPLKIISKKHDLVGIHLFDNKERQVPPIGLTHVIDAETGRKMWINFNSKKVREQYQLAFTIRWEELKNKFAKNGADLISISTKDNYVTLLRQFFKKR